MSQINSQIGLDASQALASLTALGKATQDYEADVRNLTKAFKGLPAASKALTSVGSASAKASKDLDAIRKSTERLTTSFGLLSRIVFTQAIVRGLNTLRREFSEVTRDAVEFQRQIGLIRALDTSASFSQIGEGVRALSDDLNISLADAGAAVEQAVSSQLGPLKDSLDFTRTATQFAKSVGGDARQAVELLAGTVKSFDMDPLLEAEKAASVLFRTIDLGNVNANTLATAFGRVGPTASALGVSLEETGAAISTISIRGSNTAETLTQIRGIMSALIKPSEAMSELLAKLGFNSGEAAVKTLGFEGVLRAIAKETGGSTAALGQLFQNVRALNGELALGNDEFVGLADAIGQMKVAGRELSGEAFKVAIDSDAERVTKELNQLRNAAITTLGQGLLAVADDALNILGGADTIVAAVGDHVTAATNSVHSLVEALTGNKGVVETAGDTLAALFQGGLSAVGVGGILNTLDRKQLDADVLKPLQFRVEINEQQANAEIARVKAALDERAAADKETTSKVRKEVSARVAEYDKEIKRIEELKKRVPDATDSSIQRQKDAALSSFKRGGLPLGITDPSQADAAIKKEEQRLANLRNQDAQKQIAGINFQKLQADGVDAFRVLEAQGVSTSGAIGEAFAKLQGQIKLAVVTGADQAQVQQLLADANKIGQAISGDPRATREFGDALTAAGLAIGKLNSLSLSSQVEQSAAIKKNLQDAAAVQFSPVGAGRALGGLMRAMGGRIDYRARGGRGTDTVPAMLSRGEFVVNARSAQRFFPQLQAINAGQTPTYRQDGGTTNVNVGDVNVKNVGGPSEIGLAAAREIKAILRREVRRGN